MSEEQSSSRSDIGHLLHIHGEARVRLEIDYPRPGYDGPYIEWVRSEIIGMDDGHLLVMLVDKPVVPHDYRQGQVLTVQFEQLGPTQSAIWLVPRKLNRDEAEQTGKPAGKRK
jgi:hypothetical protein